MCASKNFVVGEKHLALEGVWSWLDNKSPISIHSSVKAKMAASRKVVEDCLKDGKAHYGINTGFGSLANTRISSEKLEQLQYNLIKSHACGVGELFSGDIVRLTMLLRANVLAMGYSGVRYEVLEYLVNYINKGNIPKIPSQGSVGASGDLAPLAHLALALIDGGLKLEAKEGLSLINGIQASLAVAVCAMRDSERLIQNANTAAALTVEGLRGSSKPFDERIASVRPQDGHKKVAEFVRGMISKSEIIASHKSCSRVQDPYSLRCVPQVHGAVVDTFNFAKNIIERELSSCTDNPLVFARDPSTRPPEPALERSEGADSLRMTGPCEVISGGNFHGTSIGLACDSLATAITALGNISERRIEQMINPKQNEIPVKYLVADAGMNSGFMVAHVTASALASENKALSFPASADSITTSAGQEDFVSMSMWGARKLSQVISNTEKIIAIELMAAAQAVDMQEERHELGVGTKKVYDEIRRHVPTLKSDRVMFRDIEKMLAVVENLSSRLFP